MKTKAISCILTTGLLMAPFIGTGAFGQSIPVAPNPADRVATNLAGATTSIAPPEGFDALSAADEDLAKYGFPPRPDANINVAAYSKWRKAMLASKTRIAPQLELTQVFHGPKRDASDNYNVTGRSSNWSGVVDFSGAKSYNNSSSFYYILADYVVPVASPAYGACTGSWDYSSSWVGIDGDDSGDVLQAGTESDALCSGSTTSAYYAAWYEWYPYGEVRITNLPVNPGDDLFVEVWHTSATSGYAYIINYNTDQAVTIGFSSPPGTSLVGNSAEWIVERPTVNGALATLTNYVTDYFSSAYAYTECGKEYKPGSSGSLLLTMDDANGNPISVPTLLGNEAIEFQATGSAQ